MTEEQKKKIEEIINSWNGEMDADFHGMLMSMAKVLGRDKDITEENYREIMDEALLEIKTSGALPMWLVGFLSKNKLYKTSFSKYGNAYKSMTEKNLIGGKNCA